MVSFYPWVIADFYIQFFVAEMLFFIGLKKKPGFAPKLALCFVIYSVIAYFSLCLFMQLNFMWPYFILLLILGVCIGRLLVNV